jgi:hypothetical protein
MREEMLSEWPVALNGMFVLLLCCFLADALLVMLGRRGVVLMLSTLLGRWKQRDVSWEMTWNVLVVRCVLAVQTAVVLSVVAYCMVSRRGEVVFESPGQLLALVRGGAVVFLGFILYRFLAGWWVGRIFFPRESVVLWNNYYFSLVALVGVVLLPVALLMFYMPESYYVCVGLCLAFFLLVGLLMSYKILLIFFYRRSPLLYFILYLCAQELLPLLFLLKALVYFYGM